MGQLRIITQPRTSINRQLQKVGKDAVNFVKNEIKSNNHIASQKLYNSIEYEIVAEQSGIKMMVKSESYFKYINRGRGPGPAPIKPLISWVKSKNILFKGMTSEQTAWAVRGGLMKRGYNKSYTKPLKIEDKIRNYIMNNSLSYIKKGAIEDVQQLLNSIGFKVDIIN